MKILDIEIRREPREFVGKEGVQDVLVCKVTTTLGQIEAAFPWRNSAGIWASESAEREPAEICAALRQFAQAIEQSTKAKAA